MGLPLTSGPIALFVALDHGTGFAAATAVGALAALPRGRVHRLHATAAILRWLTFPAIPVAATLAIQSGSLLLVLKAPGASA